MHGWLAGWLSKQEYNVEDISLNVQEKCKGALKKMDGRKVRDMKPKIQYTDKNFQSQKQKRNSRSYDKKSLELKT